MKKIILIIIPSIIMLLMIFLLKNGKDILEGIYIIFPLLYIILGIIYSNKNLLYSLLLTSIAFLIPINLMFNMGSCIDCIILYNILSIVSYLVKTKIIKRRNNNE